MRAQAIVVHGLAEPMFLRALGELGNWRARKSAVSVPILLNRKALGALAPISRSRRIATAPHGLHSSCRCVVMDQASAPRVIDDERIAASGEHTYQARAARALRFFEILAQRSDELVSRGGAGASTTKGAVRANGTGRSLSKRPSIQLVRAKRHFIKILRRVPESLIESERFGYVKGRYGRACGQEGRFELGRRHLVSGRNRRAESALR